MQLYCRIEKERERTREGGGEDDRVREGERDTGSMERESMKTSIVVEQEGEKRK